MLTLQPKKQKRENSLKSKACKQKRLAHSSLVVLQESTGRKMKITIAQE